MPPFYPRHTRISEGIGERRFELERFPIHHRVQVLDEFGEQTHTKSLHCTTGPVAVFVLIEAPVRVSRGLTDVKPPAFTPSGVVQQDDVDGVACSTSTECLSAKS